MFLLVDPWFHAAPRTVSCGAIACPPNAIAVSLLMIGMMMHGRAHHHVSTGRVVHNQTLHGMHFCEAELLAQFSNVETSAQAGRSARDEVVLAQTTCRRSETG